MRELVSILMPAYNAEKWIRESITSARNQNWLYYELIVVDDGSSDNTFSIANAFQSKTVKVVRQEKRGASAARNRGLSLAQGDYIQWLDADDLLAPNKISEQMKYAEDGDKTLRLLSSAFGYFFYRTHKAKFLPTALWQNLSPFDWLLIRFLERVWIHPAAWLVSRKLTSQAGPWDERLSLNDDGEYFARVVAASEEVKFIPEAKSFYRQVNMSSLSNSLTHTARESLFLSLELSYRHLLTLENSERSRNAALTHLQHYMIYFYPEEHEILTKAAELSKKLGGVLTEPDLKFKYSLVQRICGWESAINLALKVPQFKKKIFGNFDRFLALLAQRRPLTD